MMAPALDRRNKYLLSLLVLVLLNAGRRIGQDKKFGTAGEDGPVLYISPKSRAREASALRAFPAFPRYRG